LLRIKFVINENVNGYTVNCSYVGLGWARLCSTVLNKYALKPVIVKKDKH